jgi:hypothetical protein
MIHDFPFLLRVKRRLANHSLPNAQAFLHFVIITAVDNLQLGLLRVSRVHPTRWTPLAVWGSLDMGGVLPMATYLFNGGASGATTLSVTSPSAQWSPCG